MTEQRAVSAAAEAGPAVPASAGLALGDRAFWSIFGSAWVAYGLMYVSFGVGLGEPWSNALLGTTINVVGPLAPAIPIAMKRRALLRHDAALPRFAMALLGLGLGFAVVSTGIMYGLLSLLPYQLPQETELYGPKLLVVAVAVQGFFLYLMLMGFLLFTESMQRVQESREMAAREAVARAQAEAKALRSQFNPHFVFNTLHSLMLLVRAEPATAEKAIEDVAELIRYASTLQRREVDRVTLAKEISFAERYVSLEKLRLAERLETEWHIGPGLGDALVPSFSLQTLLENAIKHGLSPSTEGGTVRIAAGLDGDDLVMSVADDGCGAEPAVVGLNGGSGLQLLGRRLQVVYGDAAELTWRTQPGRGFAATVRVPVQRAPAGADA